VASEVLKIRQSRSLLNELNIVSNAEPYRIVKLVTARIPMLKIWRSQSRLLLSRLFQELSSYFLFTGYE